MLATLERLALIEEAEYLVQMILQSEEAEQYRDRLYKLKNSKESQQKIYSFTVMKERYEEVQRFGRYHPDYKVVMMEVRTLKRELDMDPNVAEFKKAENELQSILDEVSMVIGRSVSEHIKVPTGNPFFDTGSSCGGSCGTGGGCGCSA
ncbi:YlbF family regulator [Mesobacillus harenae]|uniref:YlbF family regulator n=1 Tax=Mesobacillus harenae TaxID=2213203 RepID=UPI0015802A7C|nr:YlbF family regulator [Mesobacillus harenae]